MLEGDSYCPRSPGSPAETWSLWGLPCLHVWQPSLIADTGYQGHWAHARPVPVSQAEAQLGSGAVLPAEISTQGGSWLQQI